MQKSLHINVDKCTGCLQCEMACSYTSTMAFSIPLSLELRFLNFIKLARKLLIPALSVMKLGVFKPALWMQFEWI